MSAIIAAALVAPPPSQARQPTQTLRIALPLRADVAGIERRALAVSTPGSPDYGRYQSLEALARRFGASPETRSRVAGYLRANGASAVEIDPTGLFAEATLPVASAEAMFATSLRHMNSAADGGFLVPAASPRVPPALSGLVEGVVGLDTKPFHSSVRPVSSDAVRPAAVRRAGQPTSALRRTGTPAGCGKGRRTGGFTPSQYLGAYGFELLHRARIEGQRERVALIEIDGLRGSDVRAFGRCFGIHVPPLHAFGVGIRKPLSPGGEATLDTEMLSAAAPRLKAIDIYESHPLAVDVLFSIAAPLRNPGRRPNVISISLGLCERDELTALGAPGIRYSEGVFAMAAAAGISYVAATGDSGSAACTTDSGVPRYELGISYPASSPYVTAVGGTNLALTPSNHIAAEVVWNDLDLLSLPAAGGGGTSILFAEPSYQRRLGATRREIPDVSLLSDAVPGYAIYCTARPDCLHAGHPHAWRTVGGTSAATPLLAGAVAMIDQRLRRNGRKNLGLLNPLLYRIGHTAVFRDVRAYGNDVGPFIGGGGGRPLGCCSAGPGYDEASGWGSVDVWRLSGYALKTVSKRH